METKRTKWYTVKLHILAYRSVELLFGTHTFNFNCFLCIYTIHTLSVQCKTVVHFLSISLNMLFEMVLLGTHIICFG